MRQDGEVVSKKKKNTLHYFRFLKFQILPVTAHKNEWMHRLIIMKHVHRNKLTEIIGLLKGLSKVDNLIVAVKL